MQVEIKKGLNLPISGTPRQAIEDSPRPSSVAVLGPDYVGMKPTMLVREDEEVKLGQPLFEDKKNPGVVFTAPGTGRISAINRGARRALQSVVIDLAEAESPAESVANLTANDEATLTQLPRDQVRQTLVDTGFWTAFRTRPYSKTPSVGRTPHAIFVTAIDTNPLAADPTLVINEQATAFSRGLSVLARLTDGKVHICKAIGASVPTPNGSQFQIAEFGGKHPAGLPGTHIHFVDPVGARKVVWHIGYQDVIAFGKLFGEGVFWTERVIALGGPIVKNPRLLRTRMGANIAELASPDIESPDCRLVSGSVFNGRRANGWAQYLGRFHNQVCALEEGRHREFMGWIMPGKNKFSTTRAFLGQFKRGESFDFTTTQNGSPRAMVPIGNYEDIMPLDVLPTQLLRALLVRDTDSAQALGALELDEEDLALCSFVCVGKYDYGPVLRANLDQIEREG